jgi:hypothetical protein
MSKRDALRELSRRFPTPSEYKTLMDGLHTQTDMAIALIGGAILEAALEKILEKKLPNCPPVLGGQIFKNRGPLSDFHSKILLAQAMGVISDGLAQRLHSLKTIRNTFAHSKLPVSFDTKEVSEEIESVLIPFATMVHEAVFDKAPEQKYSPKQAFLVSIKITCHFLGERHEKLTGKGLFASLEASV